MSKLDYFKDCQGSFSQKQLNIPTRINASYDVGMKNPLYNDIMDNVYKSEFGDEKSRIKAEFLNHNNHNSVNHSSSTSKFFKEHPSDIRDKLLFSSKDHQDKNSKTGFQSFQADNTHS